MMEESIQRELHTIKSRLIDGRYDFNQVAMDIFRLQSVHNPVYRRYLTLIGCQVNEVKKVDQIPFLPIQFFKHHLIQTGHWASEAQFASSGTTGQIRSLHAIEDLAFYHWNCDRAFRNIWGDPQERCFLALLPSYLERTQSSLVSMVDDFIKKSNYQQSGFYLYDHQRLYDEIVACKRQGIPTVLFGVSFALMDFFAAFPLDFPELQVIETGGMKGRREEITKDALHQYLRAHTNAHLHSEYGMTELLSQSYAREGLIFQNTGTLKCILFEREDPLVPEIRMEKAGRIGIVDLANVATCSFILTEDLGRYVPGGFTVEGRLDESEWRGCNLMVQDL